MVGGLWILISILPHGMKHIYIEISTELCMAECEDFDGAG